MTYKKYEQVDVLKYLNIYGNLMASQMDFQETRWRSSHEDSRDEDLENAAEDLLHCLNEYQTKIPLELRKNLNFPLELERNRARESLEKLVSRKESSDE